MKAADFLDKRLPFHSVGDGDIKVSTLEVVASGEVSATLYPFEAVANQKLANLVIRIIVNLAVILFKIGDIHKLSAYIGFNTLV